MALSPDGRRESRRRSPERGADRRIKQEKRSPSPDRKRKRERRQDRVDDRASERKRSRSAERRPSKHDAKGVKKKVKKEKRKRSSSSGSQSSTASDPDDSFQQRLELDRERRKMEKKREKARMKQLETPEEKRARRLAKKLAKEQRTKEKMGWDQEYMGYSNVDNPFGDTKLTDTFVWGKKLEKSGQSNITVAEIHKKTKELIEDSRQELEQIKRQREIRESAREDLEMMARDREAQQFKEWAKQEDQFHLQQARLRSKIRIKEKRAKAIDLLARYIHVEEDDDDMDIEMHEPYHYLNGLDARDLEDLLADIKVYRRLEGDRNADYWKDVTTIAEEELSKLRKMDPNSADYAAGDRREGIHGAVRRDVGSILKGKSHHELALLETEILRKIKGQQEGVDIGYWESLLGHLKAHMARARLRDRHQETLRKKLAKLKQEQGVEGVKEEPEERPGPSTAVFKQPLPPRPVVPTESSDETSWEKMDSGERQERSQQLYESGNYSPVYLMEDDLPPATEVVDALEDHNRLEFARQNFKSAGVATSQKDAKFEAEAKKGMSSDEAVFAVEAPVEHQSFLWSDKYRPRKPRYFNRVHTGFEWNKYNQTHYDLDNPPPKIVQGYRFNIFYPDLLDPSKAPDFTLTPCDDDDFAVLRFKAGPPYEDIAFRVVNREWEISHKRGYKCQFQNGIFQLWFQFKKYRYRR